MRVSLAGLTALGELGWSGTCAAPQLDGSMDDANAWSSACYPATAGKASLLYGAEGEAVPASVASAIANPISWDAPPSGSARLPAPSSPVDSSGGSRTIGVPSNGGPVEFHPQPRVPVDRVPNHRPSGPVYSTIPDDGYVPSYLDTVSQSNAVAAPVAITAPSNSTLLIVAAVGIAAYMMFGRH